MYAVIETGGKQYRVAPGDVLRVEKLSAEAGDTINIDKVLMVAGSAVSAKVRGHGRDKKVHIFKMRRRKDSRLHAGHRQYYTEIEITAIK